MNKKLIVANWKMNGNPKFIKEFFNVFTNYKINMDKGPEVVFCPPFPLLSMVKDFNLYKVGAQNCHDEQKGAYTGEVSSVLLNQLDIDYVILGHSERRQYYREDNNIVCKKASTAFDAGLLPIICVGETLAERENNIYQDVISKQIAESVPSNITAGKLVIAYEPVWSIGTGKVPKNEDILEVFSIIRKELSNNLSEDINQVRILYGGSVNASNCNLLKDIPYLDGYLVGSASLKPTEFYSLVQSVSYTKSPSI